MQKTFDTPVYVPPRIVPGLALELSSCITGHTKVTGIVRYLALGLLYTSWHFDDAAPMCDYSRAFTELPDDDGPTLLSNLAHAPAFNRRGEQFGAPLSRIIEARSAARAWRDELTKPGLNALRLHKRALALMSVLSAGAEVNPGCSGRPELNENLAYLISSYKFRNAPAVSDDDGAGRPAGREFDNGASALEYILKCKEERTAAQPSFAFKTPAAPALASALATGPCAQVYDPLDAMVALKKLPPASAPEGNGQLRQLLTSLALGTGRKPLTEAPAGDPLQELYERFPHFSAPLDFVSGALAVSACGKAGSPVVIPPMLLRGPPGTGKTYFAQELARALGVVYLSRDLSVTSEAFVLTGLDSGWKNSKPGLVFDALGAGATANPLICLDEADKCRANGAQNSPLAALYTLLEPVSAKRFMDEFVAIPVDASHVSWVLTANDGGFPDPILSRLELFDIRAPSPTQCQAIARSVWSRIATQHLPVGHGFCDVLPADALVRLSTLSPRLMHKALMHAVSVAARQKRATLLPGDVEAGAARYLGGQGQRSIGFLAEF